MKLSREVTSILKNVALFKSADLDGWSRSYSRRSLLDFSKMAVDRGDLSVRQVGLARWLADEYERRGSKIKGPEKRLRDLTMSILDEAGGEASRAVFVAGFRKYGKTNKNHCDSSLTSCEKMGLIAIKKNSKPFIYVMTQRGASTLMEKST